MKRAITGSLLAVVASAAMLGTAASANATPTRSQCTSGYLYLYSNNTTCWANAGDVNVTLGQVAAYNSGNNAGYVQGSNSSGGHMTSFNKNSGTQAINGGTQTVNHIHIN